MQFNIFDPRNANLKSLLSNLKCPKNFKKISASQRDGEGRRRGEEGAEREGPKQYLSKGPQVPHDAPVASLRDHRLKWLFCCRPTSVCACVVSNDTGE